MRTFRSIMHGVPEGLLGVMIFSLTMPTMRLAMQDFHPTVVGVGRIVIALIPALIVLPFLRAPLPNRAQFRSLLIIVACLVFGFSWLCALALRDVPSYHAAIVIGGIPLMTAIFAALRHGQKQSRLFWVFSILGSLIVVTYGYVKSDFHVTAADLLLLLAAVVCGYGYVEGARLGREIGSLTVTCWMPILSAPLALALSLPHLPTNVSDIAVSSWVGLFYNGLFSTFIGFIFWYAGLTKGGTARIGQLQLAQPFFSLIAAGLILHEVLDLADWLTAASVVACIAVTQAASPKGKKA